MHSPDRDKGTPSFLLMSSEGNVLAKPETQEQRTRHVTPIMSLKLPLALYYSVYDALSEEAKREYKTPQTWAQTRRQRQSKCKRRKDEGLQCRGDLEPEGG